MEAAGISADQALKPRTSEVIAEFISKYGLIALLIAFPAYYGIQDLIDDGNLTRIGNNLVDGLSNGAIWALVALGYTLVYGIIELINFAHGEIFMTILLVEQNANFALGVSKRGYVLETGQIALHDKSEALRDNPEVQRAYLGA